MSDFDPEELNRIIASMPRVTTEERMLDKLEQIQNFHFNHSTNLAHIAVQTERGANATQGVVNQLVQVRSLLWMIIVLLALIAWKLVFA